MQHWVQPMCCESTHPMPALGALCTTSPETGACSLYHWGRMGYMLHELPHSQRTGLVSRVPHGAQALFWSHTTCQLQRLVHALCSAWAGPGPATASWGGGQTFSGTLLQLAGLNERDTSELKPLKSLLFTWQKGSWDETINLSNFIVCLQQIHDYLTSGGKDDSEIAKGISSWNSVEHHWMPCIGAVCCNEVAKIMLNRHFACVFLLSSSQLPAVSSRNLII